MSNYCRIARSSSKKPNLDKGYLPRFSPALRPATAPCPALSCPTGAAADLLQLCGGGGGVAAESTAKACHNASGFGGGGDGRGRG